MTDEQMLLERLTRMVEALTRNQTKLIENLKATQERVQELEYLSKGPSDGFKAQAMDRIIKILRDGGNIR